MAEKKTESLSAEAKSKISGHAFSKGGALLNGAKITCNGLETVTLADGSYIFENLSSGIFEVRVNLEGFQPESKKVSIRDNETAVLDFHLSQALGTAWIMGHIYDSESSKPIANNGTVVLVLPISNKYAHIDADGYYEFANLPAGTYSVSTSIPEYEDCDAVITVADGESKTHDLFCKNRKAIEPPWG